VGEYILVFLGFFELCTVIHLNLAYRWFCRLGLDGDVPDHSTFSKNRHGRFRESDLLRKLFDTIFRSKLRAKSLVRLQDR
jgi:transposase